MGVVADRVAEEMEIKELEMSPKRKRAMSERTHKDGEELQRIRQQEMSVQVKLQQQNEMDQLRRSLESLRIENEQLQKWQIKSSNELDEMEVRALESDSKIGRLEAELNYTKEKVAMCEREHGRDWYMNTMKKELELRTKKCTVQLNEKEQALKLIDNLEKQILDIAKLRMEVNSLREKNTAFRQILGLPEEEQPQSSELQTSGSEVKQQQLTGNALTLM